MGSLQHPLAAQELSLIHSVLKSHARRWAPLALVLLVAALAAPAAALAQDPAVDQYTPTQNPGGNANGNGGPTSPETDPTQTSGFDGGSSTGGTGSGAGPQGAPAAVAPGSSTPYEVDQSGNRAQRTLDRFAVDAQQERSNRAAERTAAAEGTDAELLSSDPAAASGLGTALPILLGLTLIWALLMGIERFRHRDRRPSTERGQLA